MVALRLINQNTMNESTVACVCISTTRSIYVRYDWQLQQLSKYSFHMNIDCINPYNNESSKKEKHPLFHNYSMVTVAIKYEFNMNLSTTHMPSKVLTLSIKTMQTNNSQLRVSMKRGHTYRQCFPSIDNHNNGRTDSRFKCSYFWLQ